jgi:GMP synthase (glutamine-hydrolysing)
MQDKVLILDFGSQYTQLIARRVRELFIYCEIYPYNNPPKNIFEYKAAILSGSPFSVRSEDAPHPELDEIKGKIPLLGVCYGAQYLAHFFGGQVSQSNKREYGRASLSFVNTKDRFFKGVSSESQVWMSHADTILKLPEHAECLASTADVKNAAYKIIGEPTYAIQFHPEVYHSIDGKQVLENFLVGIANVNQDWTPDSFVDMTLSELKEKIGNDQVLLGLSGGVDSSVAAMLLNRAIGKQLNCIFVNNGLLRKNEFEEVLEQYEGMGLNIKGVDASDQFLDALNGVSDPETKRKIIGKTFIDVFDNESNLIKGVKWLGQGTIYPDVIESISVNGPSATIKSHHNVGGLPDFMNLDLVEPLRMLFKDEVRGVGKSLGMDPLLLGRHPFPGPGLAIRILGQISREKVRMLQEVDSIFIEGLKKWDLYDQIWQAGAMFLPINSVGVMGDERTYENCVALRAVQSTDGMTADWVDLPYAFLQKISNQIINNVKGVNRVVYDISSKPPATIEWE